MREGEIADARRALLPPSLHSVVFTRCVLADPLSAVPTLDARRERCLLPIHRTSFVLLSQWVRESQFFACIQSLSVG